MIASCGIAPGRYQAILPTFVSGWDPTALKAGLTFGIPEQGALTAPETAPERRYALRAVKQRPHQASFREAVITAYSGRCALSGLPEPLKRSPLCSCFVSRRGSGLPQESINRSRYEVGKAQMRCAPVPGRLPRRTTELLWSMQGSLRSRRLLLAHLHRLKVNPW